MSDLTMGRVIPVQSHGDWFSPDSVPVLSGLSVSGFPETMDIFRTRPWSEIHAVRVPVKVVLIHPLAKMPEYGHPTDSCFDIFSVENHELLPGDIRRIQIGIKIQAPESYEFQFEDKSGLSAKGVTVRGGTIDAGYTGMISVILVNEGRAPYVVEIGDKVTQVRVQLRHIAFFLEANEDELELRDRGDNGYGSTGLTARTQ